MTRETLLRRVMLFVAIVTSMFIVVTMVTKEGNPSSNEVVSRLDGNAKNRPAGDQGDGATSSTDEFGSATTGTATSSASQYSSALASAIRSGSDGSLERCPIEIPAGMDAGVARGWATESSGGEYVTSPDLVSYCDIDYAGAPYTLIITKFANDTTLDKALGELGAREGMLFLGVPSTIAGAGRDPQSALANGAALDGSISSDDCGAYEGEIFDTGCPQGLVSMIRDQNILVIVSQRFETDSTYRSKGSTASLREILSLVHP